jgi:hypothetical protein
MPHIYEQKTGKWTHDTGAAQFTWTGYSGHGEGKNNPAMQAVHDVGPIPCGKYLIGTFFDHPEKGPVVARLTPLPETNTFGRTALELHGDSIQAPGTASLGCIIQSRPAREHIRDSHDYNLEVISGEEPAVTQSGTDAVR